METESIKANHNFPLKSRPPSFLNCNGINHHSDSPFQIADIEMVAFQSFAYTSLKDLLPASSPPGLIYSPAFNRKDSWREIPIKDPLLQHAAWAYLQPKSTASERNERQSCVGKLKDGCVGLFDCFGGLFDDVFFMTIKRLLLNGGNESVDVDDDDEEEEEEDEEEDHKVD